MLLLENIGKVFGRKWAVRGLNLHVDKGEIFGLLGPNAAGKTTTIKIMTGLLRPTEGKSILNGYDIVQQPIQAKSTFGYVPDKAFLYEKLKGHEFLKFVASIHNLEKTAAMDKIRGLTELFVIQEIQDELIESYSQGMRQRLLFVSALLHDPQILFIDEPFVGLDPYGVIMIKEVIKGLSLQGISIFLATHSLHIAEELCERVGIINRGSLITIKKKIEIMTEGGLQEVFMKATS
jgi:ABC-2 type transport system ATP-binding protein